MAWVHAVWLSVCVATALLVGLGPRACSGSGDAGRSVTRLAEPSDVIDEAFMVALAQAKNFHDKAKVYMLDGKTGEAIQSVRQILSLQFPTGASEAEDVRNDARALLAKLLIGQGKLDEAMNVVDEGLAAASRDSFFVANLHSVRGDIHYAYAGQYADAKDPKAIQHKRDAIAAFDRSIAINLKIQKQLEQPK